MISKYHDPILKLIQERGALGVNAIAKEIDVPLSTVQKYLDKQQTYFKKTPDRKWDLPTNVASEIKTNTLVLTTNLVENAILMLQSQLEEMQNNLHTVMSPIGTLKRGIEQFSAPVADSSGKPLNIHPKLIEIDEKMKGMGQGVKSELDNIPEEYHEILINTDWINLFIDKGRIYYTERVGHEIMAVVTGKAEEISDEVLEVLEAYQLSK